jgi:hypothetical protein
MNNNLYPRFMATHFLPFLSGVEYLEERFAVFALEPWHTIMILIKYFYFIFFFFSLQSGFAGQCYIDWATTTPRLSHHNPNINQAISSQLFLFTQTTKKSFHCEIKIQCQEVSILQLNYRYCTGTVKSRSIRQQWTLFGWIKLEPQILHKLCNKILLFEPFLRCRYSINMLQSATIKLITFPANMVG